jgi:hypothetical protein
LLVPVGSDAHVTREVYGSNVVDEANVERVKVDVFVALEAEVV